MKIKQMMKYLAFMLCCLMLVSIIPMNAQAAGKGNLPENVSKADKVYFQNTLGSQYDDPSLTIYKYMNGDMNSPIKDVEFKAMKIGDLYQVKDGNQYHMVYGLKQDLINILDDGQALINKSDYTFNDNGSTIYAFKDYVTINQAVQTNANRSKIQDYLKIANATGYKTDKDGIANFGIGDDGFGLYVVAETNVSEAKVADDANGGYKNVSITWQTQPYIVSVPSYIPSSEGNSGTWDCTVQVNTKNSSDEASIQKKIVKNYSGTLITDVNDATLVDTDITNYGDRVEFYLESTIPYFPDKSDGEMGKYVITDHLSQGYAFDPEQHDLEVYLGDTLLDAGKDYRLEEPQSIVEKTIYQGGTKLVITFTPGGLKKIKANSTSNVKVFYTATVKNNALIGPGLDQSGNPNSVYLTYQVVGSAEQQTVEDQVTEYLFGINLTKQLDGRTSLNEDEYKAIKFKAYSENNNTKTYYIFNFDGTNYDFTGVAASEEKATELQPNANGQIIIHGLEEGTYRFEETSTVTGYNLLQKPFDVKIEAVTGNNTFVGERDQYIGLLNQDGSTDGMYSVTVNNTKGFQLPATGGMGIWLFVIGGIAVIGVGISYFYLSGRKQRRS